MDFNREMAIDMIVIWPFGSRCDCGRFCRSNPSRLVETLLYVKA